MSCEFLHHQELIVQVIFYVFIVRSIQTIIQLLLQEGLWESYYPTLLLPGSLDLWEMSAVDTSN
jgi:hypothetical protein